MADVSVDATIDTETARACRALVYTTDQIGYMFYIDGDGVFGYSKTTDGGASWGAQVNVDGAGATTTVAFDVWFDKWTKDDTGTLIHTWWFDVTNDVVRWRALDTNGDTLGTVRTVQTESSAVAGRGAFISGTKTLSGYLYCAYDIDAGAERELFRSTDAGVTWGTTLSSTFIEATLDTCKLYPAHGTGDNNDCWAVYYDASATALTLKLWDSSAASATESATIQTKTDGASDLTGQFGHDAQVRWSDGHLIIATVSLRDNASSTHQVFDCTSTASIATKTAITTNIDDHYYPQVFIDQSTDALYVFYNGKRDGSEQLDVVTKIYYTKSTDGGTTWTAGDTAYSEAAAAVNLNVWSSQMSLAGTSRMQAVWRVAGTLLTNKVNSLAFTYVRGTTIGVGSAVNVPTVEPGAVTVTGTTISSGSQIFAPYQQITAPPISQHVLVEYYDQTKIFPFNFVYENADSFDEGDPTNIFGQTFEVSSRFSSIEMLLLSLSDADGTWDFKVHATGDPDGTVLATVTKPVSETIVAGAQLKNPAFQFVRFDFPTIDPGGTPTLYTWTLQRDGSTGASENSYLIVGVSMAPESSWAFYEGDPDWFEYSDWTYFTRVLGESVFPPTVEIEELEDQEVTGETIAAGSSVNVPTAAYALTTDTIAVGSTVTAPTVTPGDVTAVGITIAAGSVVFDPTVTPGAVTVVGETVDASSQVFVPTVAPGAVTITGETVATTAQVFVATVTVGDVAVTTTLIGTTVQLFAPSTAAVALGATITSTSGVFAASVAMEVSAPTIGTAEQVFAVTVALEQTVLAVAIASGSQAFASTVTVGDVAVTGATVTTTEQVFVPTVLAAGGVAGEFITSTAQVFALTVLPGAVEVAGAHIVSTVQVIAPTVTPGAITTGGVTVSSTAQVFAPTAFVEGGAQEVAGASVTTTAQVFVPMVAPGEPAVAGWTIVSTAIVFPPSVIKVLAFGLITSSAVTVRYLVRSSSVSCIVGVHSSEVAVTYLQEAELVP